MRHLMLHRSDSMRTRKKRTLAAVAAACVLMTGGSVVRPSKIGSNTVPLTRQEKTDPKTIKNPVPSDEKSIAEGRKVYARSCVGCHGPAGKGDGGIAVGGSTPADLTDAKWQRKTTDGEIFAVIRDGLSADMDSYKDRLTETQMWEVINYIRSLAPRER
jgi:mono/diheme cytochrome c family protein